MKKKKVFLVSLALFLLVATSMIINVHLYTKERVYNLGKSIGESSWYGPVDLGSLLTLNYWQIPSEQFDYEKNQNKWRDMIASDPTLAYAAVDIYSTDFVEGFKDGFEEQKKSQLGYMLKNNSGSTYSEYDIDMALSKNSDDFLRMTVANIKKYQALIDDLLKLDESKLNTLVNSISKDPMVFYSDTEQPIEAKELKKWLVTNGYINKVEEMTYKSMPYYGQFPTDVILLTRRISKSYPSWSNRRTLQEMKKFSLHVQNKLNIK
jgi:hypothetical protein